MSTVLERALDAVRRQQAEAADAGTPVRLVHETPRCDLLSDEQCAAMDETAGLITLDELPLTPMQRRTHNDMLAAMRAGELRGLPSCFGVFA